MNSRPKITAPVIQIGKPCVLDSLLSSATLPSARQVQGADMRDTDLDHLKKGAAVLAACVVQTLHESDPSFETRFLERLEKAYRLLRDNTHGNVQHEMELLSWTRSLLTGFSLVDDQGRSFLSE